MEITLGLPLIAMQVHQKNSKDGVAIAIRSLKDKGVTIFSLTLVLM